MTPPQFETLYQTVFLAVAVALLAIERLQAGQREAAVIARRWISNLGLLLIAGVLAGLLLPAGLHAFAANRPPGLMQGLGISLAAQVVLTFLLLDFYRYWEHRFFHAVPFMWRCHLVHHSDTQLDVTTSERHHPLEVLLVVGGATLLVAGLGLPAIGVGAYLLVAVVVNLCSHANVRVPETIDRVLRRVFVTPSTHALHHSDQRAQTDSNFATVLTFWDRLFGTYLNPGHVQAARYGLGYFHLPQDTRLGRVLQQPFRYRSGMPYAGREAKPVPVSGEYLRRRHALTDQDMSALQGAIAGSGLVLLAMAPSWMQMVKLWHEPSYQYAWLVIPMLIYLLVTRRGGLQAAVEPRPGFSGIGVVVVAAFAWCAGALTSIDLVGQFALVLALQGVAMCSLGFAEYRRLFPIFALLFLMIPSGDVLLTPLMTGTVRAMEVFPIIAGLPYSVDGFVITVAGRHYVVVDACSGLVLVTTAMFLAYCFGLLLFRSYVRVLALVLLSALLAFVCNAGRVNAIVIIDYLRGSQMELAAHTPIQWVALALMLAGLFYLVHRLAVNQSTTDHAQPERCSTLGPRRFAPVIAGVAGLFVTASAMLLSSHPAMVQATHTPDPPGALAGWNLQTPEPSWSIDAATDTRILRVTYARDRRTFDAVLIEAMTPSAKLPESRLAPGGDADWHGHAKSTETNCTHGRCMDVVHSTWVRDQKQRWRHAYYVYSMGDFQSSSRIAVRAMQGWQRLTRTFATPRLVGLVADASLEPADVAAALQALMALDARNVRATIH